MENLKNKKLTLEEAKELVAHIEEIKYDDEAAHSEEDDLRAWFIESCATGLYTKKEMIEVFWNEEFIVWKGYDEFEEFTTEVCPAPTYIDLIK